MTGTCAVEECERVLFVRGLCRSHYEKVRRTGEMALLDRPSPAERLTAKLIRMPNGCLEWTGLTNWKGYGQIYVDGKNVTTHRLSWTLANGPVSNGLCILHRCDNPACCDPEHLWLGTKADNNADMIAKGRAKFGGWQRATTHCPQSHPYDEVNTYFARDGKRHCRLCRKASSIRYETLHRPPKRLHPKLTLL